MLQGKNSWLMEKVNSGNKSAIAYLNQFDAIHKMNGNENPPPDNDWMVQYGYDTSPMVGKVESDGKTILSIARTLTKMPLSPQGFDVKDKDRQDRLWPSVVKKFEENKKMDNEELRKLQYCQFRMEILTWLRRAISTR